MNVDEAKLNALMGKMVNDLGAAISAPLVAIGDRLGLYKAMAGAGPLSAQQLAERTEIRERYLREWLNAQAASGYVDYDPGNDCYELSAEAALVFAHEDSPVNMCGAFEILTGLYHDQDKIVRAFKSGSGLGWHEHHACLFSGTERFFRPGYNANLVTAWIPALDGVAERLLSGGQVADVGCGHGASTLVMARAYPQSGFTGFDSHAPSIDAARSRAAEAGVSARASVEVAHAKNYPGTGYDLVTFFDCLHDMGDPVGAAAHVRESLAPQGSWMIVEPFAGDTVSENLTPVGRIFYCASAMVCTPCSLSQEVGLGLGAQAGEKRIRDVVREGGFTRFARVAQTPFNLIYEAKP